MANAWLSGTESNEVSTNICNGEVNMVSDLIDAQLREWKIELINSTLSRDNADRILKVPLVVEARDDMMVWRGEPFEEFSV